MSARTQGRVVPRPPVRLGRRPPQKSTAEKLRERANAGGAKGKAGFAALAGAAAIAFKNRDKLAGLLSRNRKPSTDTTGPTQ